ncbi:MAG: hypothetical protein MUC67_11445 [Acidobacteria bacterium]|nr:hypothetical protein [Acidobacteriota bacterium]
MKRHPGTWLVLSAPLTAALPFVTGLRWSAPLAAGTLAFWFLATRRDRTRPAVVGWLLGWAAALSLSFIALTAAAPESAARAIPHARSYWNEMKPWLETGVGRESSPAAFVPQHLVHLFGFVVLAAATGGWGGLVLGAYLLGYMSFYVGMAASLAAQPLAAVALAWHPWALLRVAAFVLLGVSLSRVLLERMPPRAWFAAERRRLALAGLLWGGDLLLKVLLAPHWAALLRRSAGIEI